MRNAVSVTILAAVGLAWSTKLAQVEFFRYGEGQLSIWYLLNPMNSLELPEMFMIGGEGNGVAIRIILIYIHVLRVGT